MGFGDMRDLRSVDDSYGGPKPFASAETGFRLNVPRAALVITDPQVDFLSPSGAAWAAVGRSVDENHTVENIERLLKAAKQVNMVVAIARHSYFYASDHRWGFGGPLERLMNRTASFGRPGPLIDRRDEHSGADFLPQYKPYLLNGKTIIASPHRAYAPDATSLASQLGSYRVDQVLLAGMSANLCVESHLRALLERGFEVAVAHDATAAAMLPGGDGYHAALINFHHLANALWSTDEVVRQL